MIILVRYKIFDSFLVKSSSLDANCQFTLNFVKCAIEKSDENFETLIHFN